MFFPGMLSSCMVENDSSDPPELIAKKVGYRGKKKIENAGETKTAFFRTTLNLRRFGQSGVGYVKAVVYFISKKEFDPGPDPGFGDIDFKKTYPIRESHRTSGSPKGVSFCRMLEPTCTNPSSMFCMQDQFEPGSDFFIDIDLQSSVRIVKIELEDAFRCGRVSRITTGLRCQGMHNHWSDKQWIPNWTESYSATKMMKNAPEKKIYMVPLAKIKRANIIRIELRKSNPECWFRQLLWSVKIELELDGPMVTFRKDVKKSESEKQDFTEKLDIESFSTDLWHAIVKFLPFEDRLKAMVALSATSRRLRASFRHPSFYQTIDMKNLSPFYLSEIVFNFLAERSCQFRHFRIAWLSHLPDGVDLVKFLRRIPQTMVTFVAEACPVVDDQILRTVVETQPNLETLDLTGCLHITPDAFDCISSLKELRRVSLRSTGVSLSALLKITEGCSKVEVLNLGLVGHRMGYNGLGTLDGACSKIAEKLGSTSLKAIYLELNYLSNKCLVEDFFPNCNRLEEIYLSGVIKAGNWNPDTYRVIAASCPRLRRLALVHAKKDAPIQNEDVFSFADHLHNLQHLTIIPTLTGPQALCYMLDSCHSLNHLIMADYNRSLSNFMAVGVLMEEYSRCEIDQWSLVDLEDYDSEDEEDDENVGWPLDLFLPDDDQFGEESDEEGEWNDDDNIDDDE